MVKTAEMMGRVRLRGRRVPSCLGRPCGGLNAVPIKNRKLHHHFKPLSDFLSHSSGIPYSLLNRPYTAHKFFSENNAHPIEAYYLKDSSNELAIGWVHNRNAWVLKSYYLSSAVQNFLGCNAPATNSIELPGFAGNTEYHIAWFPTRLNSTTHPNDVVDTTDSAGVLTLDLSSNTLGGVLNNYLDTLHSDYAFMISSAPIVKRFLHGLSDSVKTSVIDWDFTLYPNPARSELYIRLTNETFKEVVLFDLSGRQLQSWTNVVGPEQRLPIEKLAMGIYFIRVSDGVDMLTKKLIVQPK